MSTEGKQFQIIDTVGKGAFGTVYRAEMTGPGGFRKSVALKVLNDDMANKGDFAERLRDEARILGLLNHRAIVRVDGLRRWDGRWAVVMEFVEGVDLKRVLAAGPVPVGPALEIVEEVASALDSAFNATDSQGSPVRLLHRDIKPSNIHLTSRGEVKVLDFGVARADFQARESETRSIFFGSIGYMGPERIDGIDSHAGDVYALGVVLCELIIGKALGRSWANPDRHEAHRTEALRNVWTLCQDRELYDLLGRCLAYQPEHRPSARELSRALRRIRANHQRPWLRDWAEATVPGLAASHISEPAAADGTMVADPGLAAAGRRGDTDVMGAESGATSSGQGATGVAGYTHTSSGPVSSGQFASGHGSNIERPSTASGYVHSVPAAAADRSSLYGARPASAGVSPLLVAGGAAAAALVLVVPLGIGLAWMALQAPDGGSLPPMEPVVTTDATTPSGARSAEGATPPVAEPTPTTDGSASDAAAIDAFVDSEPEVPEADPPEAPTTRADAGRPTRNTPSSGRREPPPPAPDPEPEPDPAPTAVPTGRVVVTGDAGSVRLVGGGTTYPPGAVPAGSYEVRADFGTGALRSAGQVVVPADGVVTLSCRAGLKRCAPR